MKKRKSSAKRNYFAKAVTKLRPKKIASKRVYARIKNKTKLTDPDLL